MDRISARSRHEGWPRQRDRWIVLGALLLAGIGLAVAVVGSVVLDVPLVEFLGEPDVVLGAHAGVLSMAGNLIWAVAAGVAVFAGLAVVADPTGRQMLVGIATLVGVMTVDDAFQVHENVVPLLLGARLEVLLFAGYAVAGLVLLVRHHRRILQHRPLWLAVAVGLLGASVAIDLLGGPGDLLAPLKPVEDVPKWFGIVLSGAWLLRTATAESFAAPAVPERSGIERGVDQGHGTAVGAATGPRVRRQ